MNLSIDAGIVASVFANHPLTNTQLRTLNASGTLAEMSLRCSSRLDTRLV